MPVKINVGPPVITIHDNRTFMVSDASGEITGQGEFGVFADDTRFVSHYAIFVNGQPWLPLTSSATSATTARIYLANPSVPTEDGPVAPGTLALTIGRIIDEGVHEDLDVANYGLAPVQFNLEIALRSDFADLFEVKQHAFTRRGHTQTEWSDETGALHTSYVNGDFSRRFTFHPFNADSRPHYANGRITFEIDLGPGEAWHACCEYVLAHDGRERAPVHEHRTADPDDLAGHWFADATTLTSSNEDVYRLYHQSLVDMTAMRLRDYDSAANVWVAAAGVPWFVTLFGRDSLIVGLQTLPIHPCLTLGALENLARFQATERDDWRDAEPGKIPHEIRSGELAHFKRIPHTPYYGTADATPLYLIALHEAWKWQGDIALLRKYRDVALRCLDWIDRDGDLDGDGFQEYQTRSTAGYENMGWKDSGDAVVSADGHQVTSPKALCELQGYVFDAWMRMAEAFDALDERERAATLRAKAIDLQTRFEARFWSDEIGCYVYGLGPDKEPIQTVASNAGHLLWSGIAEPAHAAQVVERLLEPDMWSGWGIRTLSAKNPAFNPHSYHRGSVWPHDNGIIALGFRRYGFPAEAARVARAVSEAASYFVSYQLPELYAGIERKPGTFPVLYPGANVPQAWAAGSIFHLLAAILGLRADAPNGQLFVDPALPAWLPDVTLHGINVGTDVLDLRFWREGDRSRWDVVAQRRDVQVTEQAWQPWMNATHPTSDSRPTSQVADLAVRPSRQDKP
jgi:glycogen debranching enzyme